MKKVWMAMARTEVTKNQAHDMWPGPEMVVQATLETWMKVCSSELERNVSCKSSHSETQCTVNWCSFRTSQTCPGPPTPQET